LQQKFAGSSADSSVCGRSSAKRAQAEHLFQPYLSRFQLGIENASIKNEVGDAVSEISRAKASRNIDIIRKFVRVDRIYALTGKVNFIM